MTDRIRLDDMTDDQLDQLYAEVDEKAEQLRFLRANTLPELRRRVEHEQGGKARWRERAKQAEAKLAAVRKLCSEPDSHPGHDHICPNDILAAMDGQLDHSTDARKATAKPSHESDIRTDEDGWYVSCQDCDARDEVGSEHDAEAWAERHKANPDEVRGLG